MLLELTLEKSEKNMETGIFFFLKMEQCAQQVLSNARPTSPFVCVGLLPFSQTIQSPCSAIPIQDKREKKHGELEEQNATP